MTEGNSVCGIVMPISAIDGCSEGHWKDVLEILSDAVKEAGFDARIVSSSDDIGIIQKRIVQNLYENPIVVCDVSGKNPNVMFELGMRLAFDKPTIIVMDDSTSISFDTSSIEHLFYPRDLRFGKIVEFKTDLAKKIRATHKQATQDPDYTTFLKHFGEFKVARIEETEVSGQEFILEELRALRTALDKLQARKISQRDLIFPSRSSVTYKMSMKLIDRNDLESLESSIRHVAKHPAILDFDWSVDDGEVKVVAHLRGDTKPSEFVEITAPLHTICNNVHLDVT